MIYISYFRRRCQRAASAGFRKKDFYFLDYYWYRKYVYRSSVYTSLIVLLLLEI